MRSFAAAAGPELGEPMNKRTYLAGAMVCGALAVATVGTAPIARAADERVWTLGGIEDKNADSIYLGYGVPETDDSFGSFTCKPGGGSVKVWIAETNQKLKPGKPATAVLSAGGVKTRVAGKLMPNEEAGVPSFEGSFKANDPIFAQMLNGGTLEVVVGPSKQTAPLSGAAEKFKKFAAACVKP